MEQNHKKICGIVTEEVTQNEEKSLYKICADGQDYEIVSTGRQALKDYLFIRKGQKMEVEGCISSRECSEEKLCSKNSKIYING